jgi:hypothetical protein
MPLKKSAKQPRLLQPGDLGVDYSGARPAPHATRHAGGHCIIRYSAGLGNTQPATAFKLCGRNELHDAIAAGLDVIANSEWYESRITEGADAGKVDGEHDLRFWRSRGLAKGASIYVSWDEDPDPAHWPAAIAYLKAYDAELGGHYHVDCYAGTPFLRHAKQAGVIRYGWRTNAGSWSNDGLPYQPNTRTARARAQLVKRAVDATPAHIWQTGNYWFNNGADENLIVRTPVGSHLEAHHGGRPGPGPKPPVPPKPQPGAHRLVSSDGNHVLTVSNDKQLLLDGQPFDAAGGAK